MEIHISSKFQFFSELDESTAAAGAVSKVKHYYAEPPINSAIDGCTTTSSTIAVGGSIT